MQQRLQLLSSLAIQKLNHLLDLLAALIHAENEDVLAMVVPVSRRECFVLELILDQRLTRSPDGDAFLFFALEDLLDLDGEAFHDRPKPIKMRLERVVILRCRRVDGVWSEVLHAVGRAEGCMRLAVKVVEGVAKCLCNLG